MLYTTYPADKGVQISEDALYIIPGSRVLVDFSLRNFKSVLKCHMLTNQKEARQYAYFILGQGKSPLYPIPPLEHLAAMQLNPVAMLYCTGR